VKTREKRSFRYKRGIGREEGDRGQGNSQSRTKKGKTNPGRRGGKRMQKNLGPKKGRD